MEHIMTGISLRVPSQWETSLQCNDVTHWLGAHLDGSLSWDYHDLTEIGTWISNYIHYMLNVITHPCPNFNISLTKLPLVLGHGWVISTHCYMWIKLVIHAVILVLFFSWTKQFNEWFFCPSVRLSHLFHYAPIIVSSWNFRELIPMTRVRSMK